MVDHDRRLGTQPIALGRRGMAGGIVGEHQRLGLIAEVSDVAAGEGDALGELLRHAVRADGPRRKPFGQHFEDIPVERLADPSGTVAALQAGVAGVVVAAVAQHLRQVAGVGAEQGEASPVGRRARRSGSDMLRNRGLRNRGLRAHRLCTVEPERGVRTVRQPPEERLDVPR
nr:hypothetical protein [Propionibacterium freudenreichii]